MSDVLKYFLASSRSVSIMIKNFNDNQLLYILGSSTKYLAKKFKIVTKKVK